MQAKEQRMSGTRRERTAGVTVAALWVFAGSAAADEQGDVAVGEGRAVYQALGEATQFHFVDTRLERCLEVLAGRHEIGVVLDEVALLESGIDADEPIDLTVEGVSLEEGLQRLLRPMGLGHFVED